MGRATRQGTEEGPARIKVANLNHGRMTNKRLAKTKAPAQANREISYALKMRIELAIRDVCVPKNYRP